MPVLFERYLLGGFSLDEMVGKMIKDDLSFRLKVTPLGPHSEVEHDVDDNIDIDLEFLVE